MIVVQIHQHGEAARCGEARSMGVAENLSSLGVLIFVYCKFCVVFNVFFCRISHSLHEMITDTLLTEN